ncbi:Uncharacterized protein dnm_082920 [Desulfonema magnum]|uniref:Uncharacterized protein n=1 Tax=Desulfonema magnum TaxID=45655 RepID=A0A975GSM5_9BACT|nr:Uncharacterized protein dnm_082920 [Desulfonema magnum]
MGKGIFPESMARLNNPVSQEMTFSMVISIKHFKRVSFENYLLSGYSDKFAVTKKVYQARSPSGYSKLSFFRNFL